MNLAGKTWGGTDQAYKTVLTKPTASSSVATGIRVQDGEGTNTGLFVDAVSVGPVNAGGFHHPIGANATANRTATLSDASGIISPELIAVLASDATNSTTTPSAIASFGVPLELSATYEFQVMLRVQSAATATGIRTQITGPTSQIDFVCYEYDVILGTALATPSVNRESLVALATVSSPATSPVANTDFLVHYRGLLKTTAVTPASDIGISFHSETGASQVTVRSGSFIRFRKIKQG